MGGRKYEGNHPRMGSDPHFAGKMGNIPHSTNRHPHIPHGHPSDCFITPRKHIHDPQLWYTHTHIHPTPLDHPVLVMSNGGIPSVAPDDSALCHSSLKIFFCSTGRVETRKNIKINEILIDLFFSFFVLVCGWYKGLLDRWTLSLQVFSHISSCCLGRTDL